MNMETILGRNIDLFFFEPFLPRFSITVTGHRAGLVHVSSGFVESRTLFGFFPRQPPVFVQILRVS